MSNWKKLSSKYVYQNPWMKVREDQVIQPDGKESIFGVVEDTDGVSIIPVEKDGKIWMVKNYRYIYNRSNWEFVGGAVDEGENFEQAARRELMEELELDAEEFVKIGQFQPSNGRLRSDVEVFIARGLKTAGQEKKDWDVEERKAFSLYKIDEMIKSGEVVDGFVMTSLYFYKLYLDAKGKTTPS